MNSYCRRKSRGGGENKTFQKRKTRKTRMKRDSHGRYRADNCAPGALAEPPVAQNELDAHQDAPGDLAEPDALRDAPGDLAEPPTAQFELDDLQDAPIDPGALSEPDALQDPQIAPEDVAEPPGIPRKKIWKRNSHGQFGDGKKRWKRDSHGRFALKIRNDNCAPNAPLDALQDGPGVLAEPDALQDAHIAPGALAELDALPPAPEDLAEPPTAQFELDTLQDAPIAPEDSDDPRAVQNDLDALQDAPIPPERSVTFSEYMAMKNEFEEFKARFDLLQKSLGAQQPMNPVLAEQEIDRDLHYAPNRQENIPENIGNRRVAEEHVGFLQLYHWLPHDQTMLFRPELRGKMPQIVTEIKDAEFFYELNKGYLEPLWAELDDEQQGKWKDIQMELEAEQKYQMENQWIRKRAQNRGRKRKNRDGAEIETRRTS